MAVKPKYHKRIFSGKEVPVIGIDQGKSPLYLGDAVHWMFNGFFDSSLMAREGQLRDTGYVGDILAAGRLGRTKYLCAGTSIWAEAI